LIEVLKIFSEKLYSFLREASDFNILQPKKPHFKRRKSPVFLRIQQGLSLFQYDHRYFLLYWADVFELLLWFKSETRRTFY